MKRSKSIIAIFIFFMIGCGWFVNASASEKDKDTWPVVAITADDGWYDWYYEQLEPEAWLLASDEYYGEKDDNVRAIFYRDVTQELVYPLMMDANNEGAEPVEVEKVNICGVSTMAITLRKSMMPRNPVNADIYDGPLYGYERIFLNLEKERQSVQFDDDYATETIKSNDPLEEFLARTEFTCENGFITFPDGEDR